MEKIDRLGWTAGISLVAYGARFGIRTNDPLALEKVIEHLPPGWKPAPSPSVDRLYSLRVGHVTRPNVRPFHLLYGNLQRLARTPEYEQVFDAFESDVELFVAEWARRKLFVHAGVVGWHGRAILLPGKTFTGKSTLVAELVRAGATYYSDEFAVLDGQGRVYPFPRSLSIRGEPTSKPTKYRVEELGGQLGSKPLPIVLVIVSEYREGAKWRPRKLSAGQGALELLANTVAARRQQKTVLATLGRVASQATVLKGTRGGAQDIVAAILKSAE